MQILRERRGVSRLVLAGLLGVSPSWVKKAESGEQHMSKLPTVLRVAEVLRVRDLADLTGDQSMPVDLFIGPGHPRLAAVKAAVDRFPFNADRPAPPAEHLKARLALAWAARHKAPNHREVIGGLLPDLIRDAQLTVHQADTAAERRTARSGVHDIRREVRCNTRSSAPCGDLGRQAHGGATRAPQLPGHRDVVLAREPRRGQPVRRGDVMTAMGGTRICVRCDRPITGEAETGPQLWATSGARPDDQRHRDDDPECCTRTVRDP
ncbi:helix-turn-helix transcriptional regulator [Streptomyces sp. NPDC048389]|uniref:helix-turn-helix domain-containing protein n=1 Tax=Streptomyces sp. NPDC048389 TaxID=3154622 RepID=UPI0034551512